MTVQLKPPRIDQNTIFYPESDGKSLAESDLHRDILFYIIHLLQRFFRGRRVYVSGNLLLCYEEARQQAEEARQQAEHRVSQVEDENAHLREELARLRRELK